MNYVERAAAILEILQQMRAVRRATLAYQGWSWRAAGYHHDPDASALDQLDELAKRLDVLLYGVEP